MSSRNQKAAPKKRAQQKRQNSNYEAPSATDVESEVDSGFVDGTEPDDSEHTARGPSRNNMSDTESDAPSVRSARSASSRRRQRRRGRQGGRGDLAPVKEAEGEKQSTEFLDQAGQETGKELGKPTGQAGQTSGGQTGNAADTGDQAVQRQQGQQAQQKEEKSSGGGGHDLKLRLDLNLEIEIELKATIRGDLTLSLM
ncbi:MAG: hypothetical protein M1833_004948 [Piccolia ochrophora]|nr:MAG: hypothetical protein M1833_004948 [Piccolia ochrophora]